MIFRTDIARLATHYWKPGGWRVPTNPSALTKTKTTRARDASADADEALGRAPEVNSCTVGEAALGFGSGASVGAADGMGVGTDVGDSTQMLLTHADDEQWSPSTQARPTPGIATRMRRSTCCAELSVRGVARG